VARAGGIPGDGQAADLPSTFLIEGVFWQQWLWASAFHGHPAKSPSPGGDLGVMSSGIAGSAPVPQGLDFTAVTVCPVCRLAALTRRKNRGDTVRSVAGATLPVR
jgi:hypothetical protein